MNWIDRQEVLFSGHYRLCRTTKNDWDVWYYGPTQCGILKRGFGTVSSAKSWAETHDAREQELMRSLDAVSLK